MNYMMIISVLVVSVLFSPSQQKLITVDSDHGKDDDSCINSGTSKDGSHPCKTLYQALKGITNNTLVHILNGTYSHNTTNTTLTFSHVSITGDGADGTIVQCNNTISNGSGFGFVDANNISISGLAILGCGQKRNSTTINGPGNETLLFRAALYYLKVEDVIIDDVIVSNSIGMGVAMYDVTGCVSVTNSLFANNSVSEYDRDNPGGGGFSVEFTYCTPGMAGLPNTSCNSTKVHANTTIRFYKCRFHSNKATASSLLTSTTTYANTAYGFGNQQFGRGGGLSVFLKGFAINNSITIDCCHFSDNYAIWGAGFHSDIVDNSAGNHLCIRNSVFINNWCHMNDTLLSVNTGGGGMRIALLFSDARSRMNVTSNHIIIEQCVFKSNSAYYGGGVSYRITKEDTQTVATNSIRFINCTWFGNRARTGSGIDIAAHPFPLGITPVAIVKNCNFTYNSNHYSNNYNTPVGIGAIYSDNFPINFTGDNMFVNNTGSALAGSATHFMFSNDSITTFHHNVGTNGGAIALLGNAFLILDYNANLKFTANQAYSKGGAIYYVSNSERDFISTQKCFLFYYDTSAEQFNWNTSVQFEDNHDLQNKSIFSTTLLPCVWGNLPGSSNVDQSTVNKVFNGTFHYNNDPQSHTANNSMTDAINIKISINKTNPVQIPPGKLYQLNITSRDEVGNQVNPVFFVQTLNPNVSVVDSTTKYISDNKVKLFGVLKSNISLQLQTVNGRPWSITINITLSDCPPGFYYDNATTPHNGTYGQCTCSTNSYYGLYQCDRTKLIAYMHAHIWGGIIEVNESLKFVTADCPVGYCINTKAYYKLPAELSKEADKNISNTQCYNRHRELCGRCKPGYYVSTKFPTFECYNCSDGYHKGHRILLLILLKYVPFTIFMLVLIFFNISLVNGPLNSYILFSQIINSEGLYASGNITGLTEDGRQQFYSAYYFPYGVWNLNFFEVLVPKFCAYYVNTTMKVLILEYIPAFYPVVLFILFYSIIPWLSNRLVLSNIDVLRRCILKAERMFIVFRRSWSVKNSIIHGLTTFLVLSYAKVTVVTSLLLASTTLYGVNGTDIRNVARLDGTMHYLHKDHVPYAAVGFVSLFTIVLLPPLLLLSYPLLPNLITKLNCQDKWMFKKLIIKPMDKCAPFFDAFQSCYKDKYRFFAGLYFLYRAMALAVLTFTWKLATRLIYQQGFYLSVMLIHFVCQPYKKKRYNILDGFIVAILVATNGLALYNLFSVEVYLSTPQTSLWIQLILLYIPLIYFLVFVSYHTIKWCFPRVNRVKIFLFQLSTSYQTVPTEDDDAMPARLLDTDDSSNNNSEDDEHVDDEHVDDNDEQDNHVDDQDDYIIVNNVVDNKQSNHVGGERVVEMNLPVQWNDQLVTDDSQASSPTGVDHLKKYHSRFTT
ncbi:uncharacterized protein [Dysidea avara]|uniref:uncharacterized protein n=1 Tax=Dysidea avara TaxID=196820 RepID=UPI003325E29F